MNLSVAPEYTQIEKKKLFDKFYKYKIKNIYLYTIIHIFNIQQ